MSLLSGDIATITIFLPGSIAKENCEKESEGPNSHEGTYSCLEYQLC